MAEQSQGFMIADEPEVMQSIVTAVMQAIQEQAAVRHLPMPVALNAMVTAMARVTMMAILDHEEERRGGQAFEMEAARRIFDAVASMEDYHERKTPWRLQSSMMKQGEANGARVQDATAFKATKQ
jgi:hypothetical protein